MPPNRYLPSAVKMYLHVRERYITNFCLRNSLLIDIRERITISQALNRTIQCGPAASALHLRGASVDCNFAFLHSVAIIGFWRTYLPYRRFRVDGFFGCVSSKRLCNCHLTGENTPCTALVGKVITEGGNLRSGDVE